MTEILSQVPVTPGRQVPHPGPSPLWTPGPARIAGTNLHRFIQTLNTAENLTLTGSKDLHAWSIANVTPFWAAIWAFCEIEGEKGARVLIDGDRMPGARFFPDATLNFAQNLLRQRGTADALVFRGEDKVEKRWSWDELAGTVSRLQQALLNAGVEAGDRVAAVMPNMPETVAAMLATASIGAIWSSCSPDFGERGILDRFGQITPKVLLACDGYHYAGKRLPIGDKLKAVVAAMPGLTTLVLVDYLGEASALTDTIEQTGVFTAHTWDGFLAPFEARAPDFVQLPFAHPLYIMFSSGTTGVPKCIVHSAGGTLLQQLKEHTLNVDVRPGDRMFYFTTCGWMMWNWLVSALAAKATLLLFDGSPFHPVKTVLFDYADAERMTQFGTSAKYIDACRKEPLAPLRTHDLGSLRTMLSTGSPLAAENFDYVYTSIKPDLHLASISGGTDIVSCFVLGDPTLPVYRGEIQSPGLGMAVDVWNDDGEPVRQEKGELVCTAPFPSMPLQFWNDTDGTRYHTAYFERFPHTWCHGDFAEWTRHDGMIIHGRSDATLNPGGVRIGTAELYAQVERIPEVLEALAIGQTFADDVRIVLFVRLAEGVELDDALVKRIKADVRQGASPRHVPAKIVAVPDLPRTKSGKITELAVRDIVHGRAIKNKEALANPGALDFFKDLPELAQ